MISARLLRFGRFKLTSSPAAVAYVAAALILCIGCWQILRAREAALREADQDARNLARSLAQHATRSIEAVDIVLSGMVERLEHGAMTEPARFKTFLVQRAAAIAQVHSIAVLDAEGRRITDSLEAPHALGDSSDRAYFRRHRDQGDADLHLDDPITGNSSGLPGIPLSRRWTKPDGSFGGVIVAFLSPSYFQRFYNTIDVGRSGSITIFSTGGRYLVRHPYAAEAAGLDVSGSRPFREMLTRSGVGSLRNVSPVDGLERIAGYERLEGYPLILLAALAVDETLAPWRREAVIEGTVLGLAAVALVVLWLALTRHRRSVLAAESAHRISEAQLHEKSKLLGATLASMDQGLIVVSRESFVEVCNPRAMTLLDLPATLMETRPSTQQVLEHQIAAGEFPASEGVTGTFKRSLGFVDVPHAYERRRANGTVLEIRTMPLEGGGVVRTYTDVTARRNAEIALQASEARYRQLAETTSDVITHLRLPDFERVYVSPACRTLFGCEPEEMLGQRPSASNMHPDDAAGVRGEASRLARGEAEHAQATYRARHKDGHWLWVEASLSLMRDEHTGKPTALVCSLRDVTERQRQAEELRQAKIEAEAAARSKSDFLATMSHEIRTPLNSVIGYADLLLDDPGLGAAQRHRVERIQGAGAALLTVVNDILDFSKIEAGQIELNPQPFHLDALIDNAVSIVRGFADAKGLRVAVDVAADLPRHLVGDQDRLRQILLNLLNNAVKFTRDGSVTLTISGITADAASCALRFAVSDTGIGIPGEKRARLFQRFSQVDGSVSREFGGTGLGLAISKNLVEMMGGEIGVDSVVDEGSTFWFTASLARGALPMPAIGAPLPTPNRVRPLRILLVEDVAINRELACAVLEKGGHAVETAADGAAAIAAVQERAYDLVLMDVQMPGMDGITATRRIRALDHPASRLPIIAMTANVLPEQVAAFRAAGMDDHIGKPFRQDALQAVIARWADAHAAPPAGGVIAAGVVDAEMYDGMLEVLGLAKMNELLGALAEQLAERFAEGSLDPRDLAAQAHALVSTAGMVGFAELSGLCADLEAACLQGRATGALLEQVRSARGRALQEIRCLREAA